MSVQPSAPVGSADNSVSTCLCSRVRSDNCSLENWGRRRAREWRQASPREVNIPSPSSGLKMPALWALISKLDAWVTNIAFTFSGSRVNRVWDLGKT